MFFSFLLYAESNTHTDTVKCFFFFPPLCREQYTYSCGRASMILGVHPFALKANISDRVAQLAMPKPEPEGHTEQRSVCHPLL